MKSRLNVFLLTDVEGIAGINTFEEMSRDPEPLLVAGQKLSKSINTAVAACFDAGADKVFYLDGHHGGGNVIEDLVDPRAEKVTILDWFDLLERGEIDCQVEIGAHAHYGTIGGFLDHTLCATKIFSLRVNGRDMSEFALHAVLCAKFNVPIVAVVGDKAASEQVKEYVPSIYSGAVKEAKVRNIATTYENADEILYNTIKAGIDNRDKVGFIDISEPVTVEQTFTRTDFAEEILEKCEDDVVRVDARTLRKTIDKITKYADLRF